MPELELVDETIPAIVGKTDINQKAEEIRLKRELPKKPGNRVSFKELLEWLALLPEGVEERLTIWIYRTDPVINKQLNDPTVGNSIDILYGNFSSLTEESIISKHGGGSYKFVVKDEDNKGKQIGGFFEARLTIQTNMYPPKLELSEVEWDNPRNKGYRSWCRGQKLIDENNMPVELKAKENANNNNAPMNDTVVQMMKMVMDYTTKMSEKDQQQFKKQVGGDDALTKSIGDILLEKMKQDDPNKQLTALVSIMTAMKGMTPEVKQDNTLATIMPMFMTMMTQMNESANRQMTIMLELFKSKTENTGTASEKTPISEVKELFTLFQDMSGGNGGKKSTAEVVGSIIENNLTPVLNIVGSVIAMKAAQTNGAPKPVPPPSNVNPQANVTEAIVTTQPMSQPNQLQPNEAVAIIQQFGPIIINKLAGEGWEFGAWIAEGFGDMTAVSITKYGVDGLLAAAKMVPEFWQKIESSYGESKLKEWLKSFVNYKEEIAKMDQEGEVQE